MVGAGGAVERAGRDQDPEVGQLGDRRPAVGAVRAAGGPQVERRLGVVDGEARGLERRPQRGSARGVPLVLLRAVPVVSEYGGEHALLRPGIWSPRFLRTASSSHDRPVAGDERTPVAGQVRALRHRVHREDAFMAAPADVRVQHGVRRALPAALDVALVGDQQHAALTAPVHDLLEVLLGSTRPVGFDGELSHSRRGVSGPERGQRVGRDGARAHQRRADLVGRVGQLGKTTRSPGPMPRWSGSDAISSLEPITGSTWSMSRPVTPWARASQSTTACRVSGRPTVSG